MSGIILLRRGLPLFNENVCGYAAHMRGAATEREKAVERKKAVSNMAQVFSLDQLFFFYTSSA